MKNNDSTMDLFSLSNEIATTEPKLDVVKLDYLGSESLTWRELFSGFDRLRAITFSSGIGFVYQLKDKFCT